MEEESPLEDVSVADQASDDVERLIHDAEMERQKSLPSPVALPHYVTTAAENGGLSLLRTHSGSAASQQTYFMSSLASSLLSQLPEATDEMAEKPHHLEKALTDLLSEPESPKLRVPLANFNVQNYDTSALESGLHWNGGPPKLFVDRCHSLSNSFGRTLRSSFSSDIENLSLDMLDSTVISKPSQPFLLASQFSNFEHF